MLKPTILNIILFWFAKYILFYLFLMLKNGNYTFIKVNQLQTFEDWIYYLWLFLFMPVLSGIFLTAPIFFSFKLKYKGTQILILLILFIIEYFGYTYIASPSNYWNGLFNILLGVLIFLFFFYKHLTRALSHR
jgi:hypothetical protein